jgi:hypothetical protein
LTAAAIFLAIVGTIVFLAVQRDKSVPELAGSHPLPQVNPPPPATSSADPSQRIFTIATLDRLDEAEWGKMQDGDNSPSAGLRLRPGDFLLKNGSARILLDNGVAVVVHGPCDFGIVSTIEMNVKQGSILAQMPPFAQNFTVHTPSTSVVDLGTEFGVTVDQSGDTETCVLRGHVRIEPRTGDNVELTADMAARVDSGHAARFIAPAPDKYMSRLSRADLADIVAGGDGTTNRRGRGINVADGSTGDDRVAAARWFAGDNQLRHARGLPMVAGVVIPSGALPIPLDPAGHTFGQTGPISGKTYGWIWSGGPIPISGDLPMIPTRLNGVDYASAGHGCIFLHGNKEIVFDLDAIRAAQPGWRLTRFKTLCGNTSAGYAKASLRSSIGIFVDGSPSVNRPIIRNTDLPFELACDLGANSHYLTILATDGGDSPEGDWLILGDPRLE